jgi:hypothetical protein
MTDCELPFWEDPALLIHPFHLTYHPSCIHSSYNFMARMGIVTVLLACVVSGIIGIHGCCAILIFGIVITAIIVYTTPIPIHKKDENKDKDKNKDKTDYIPPLREHFVNGYNGSNVMKGVQPIDISPTGMMEVDAAPYAGEILPDYTPPTARNPFMNLLIDQIKYNPDRPEAGAVNDPTIKQTLDDYFRIHWFSDPTDVFGKNQSQRQFITQPSTTVPNDQGSFANWLYRIPGKTCKEGGRAACVANGSEGAVVPWLS